MLGNLKAKGATMSKIVSSVLVVLCICAAPLYAQSKKNSAVSSDAGRLAAILTDAQNTKVNFSSDAWRVTANEANALANRIYTRSGGRAEARDLRTHVRQMHDAAMKGDASGARSHAGMAMPFAYKLTE
jgi:hypothetical protein